MENDNLINSILRDFNNGKKSSAFMQISNLIKKNPDNLEYLFLYAKMCNQVNKLDESEKVSLFLFSKNNRSVKYLHNLYSTYLKKNNINKSEIFIKKLLTIDNKHYEAQRDLGYIEYTKGEINNAQKILGGIVNEKNNDPFALNILGLVLIKKKLTERAIKLFERAISTSPKYIDSYNNLGKAYFDLEDIDEAFKLFKIAYKINQNYSKTLNNIGNFLSLKDKNIFAIKSYKKALIYEPQNFEIYSNIALAYARNKDFKNAKKFYEEAKNKNISNPSLELSLSYLYIYKNQFHKAWNLFESRKQTSKFLKSKKLIVERTTIANKDTILNKKILILREQGIGEEILFSSMYKELIDLPCDLKIETDKRLISIFERSFKNNVFIPDGYYSENKEKLKMFDSVIFAGSLCGYFRKSINDFLKKPYLIVDSDKTRKIKNETVFQKNNLKIGISWKSVVSIYGRLKSLNLFDFAPLIKNGRQFINLQYGEVNEEIKRNINQHFNLHSFTKIDLFNDLESLMGILKNLDAFVTVSNSTAHIAAAMGVKTLLICPKKSSTYFYWNNENNNNPWYPNIEIFKIENSLEKTIKKIDERLNNL